MSNNRMKPERAKSGNETVKAGGLSWSLVVALLVLAVCAIGWTWREVAFAQTTALPGLGQRGDFFGGILNPILTFLTFLALLATLILQRMEMVESRIQFTRSADALTRQNVQSSFYQLLAVHNQIISGLSVVDPAKQEVVHGREVFRVIYSDLRRDFRERLKRNRLRPRAARRPRLELITSAYRTVYGDHQEKLGHYFRYLYNTLLLLEEAAAAENPPTGEAERFIKILRALLSDQELLVLYYNVTVSEQGQNFRQLAIDHQLFDNMPARLLEDVHATYLDAKALGPVPYKVRREALRLRTPSIGGGSAQIV